MATLDPNQTPTVTPEPTTAPVLSTAPQTTAPIITQSLNPKEVYSANNISSALTGDIPSIKKAKLSDLEKKIAKAQNAADLAQVNIENMPMTNSQIAGNQGAASRLASAHSNALINVYNAKLEETKRKEAERQQFMSTYGADPNQRPKGMSKNEFIGALSQGKFSHLLTQDYKDKQLDSQIKQAELKTKLAALNSGNDGTWSAISGQTDDQGNPMILNNKTGEIKSSSSISSSQPLSPQGEQIKANLLSTAGTDQKVDPSAYLKAKNDYVTNTSGATDNNSLMAANAQFDKLFGNLLSPQEQKNLGIQGVQQSNGAKGTTGSDKIDTSTPGYSTQEVPGTGGLTQAALDKASMQYAMTGQMPSIGLGSTGSAKMKRDAIMNRAAELDSNGNIAQNKATLSSLTNSLNEQTKYQNTMERATKTVEDNLTILENAANKVNKSGSPLVNEWNNLVTSKVIGSGDLASYRAAIQTVRNEYQFILARGGQVSDTVRQEAQTLIPDNITKEQLVQVIGTLRAEGQNVLNNANSEVSSIQNRINGVIGGSQPGSAASNSTGGKTTSGLSYTISY